MLPIHIKQYTAPRASNPLKICNSFTSPCGKTMTLDVGIYRSGETNNRGRNSKSFQALIFKTFHHNFPWYYEEEQDLPEPQWWKGQPLIRRESKRIVRDWWLSTDTFRLPLFSMFLFSDEASPVAQKNPTFDQEFIKCNEQLQRQHQATCTLLQKVHFFGELDWSYSGNAQRESYPISCQQKNLRKSIPDVQFVLSILYGVRRQKRRKIRNVLGTSSSFFYLTWLRPMPRRGFALSSVLKHSNSRTRI